MQPAVITSRVARKDLNRIRSEHSLILEGIANHNVRVDALNQQKAAELQSQNTMRTQMDQERQVADTTAKRDAMDFSIRQGELDIKRAALSSMD